MPTYRHTQHGPWFILLVVIGLAMASIAWSLPGEPLAQILFPVVGGLMLVLAAAFQHLTVEDEGDQLAVRFGPLPLFRRRIRYDDIQNVAPGRTIFLDGWGIHASLRGGWVWNIWGWDCVVLHLTKGTLRVGTNDQENLLAFLREKLAERGSK